jgi:hypothetical protein
MPYTYALYSCLICMPYMYALYVCLTCMPYMYAGGRARKASGDCEEAHAVAGRVQGGCRAARGIHIGIHIHI